MRRNEPGLINAYILNLLRFSDSRYTNEYELAIKIKNRFKFKPKPKDIRKYHIIPLIERHWLKEIRINGEILYRRVGELEYISNPRATLSDQFQEIDPDLRDSLIDYIERELESDYIASLTEKEYNEYFSELWEKHLEDEKRKEKNEIDL